MSDGTPPVTPALREKTRVVAEILDAVYGPRLPHEAGDPTEELVGTILSQHTSDVNSARAFASLKAEYPNWDAVVDAPVDELAEVIRVGGLANQKAPRIQRALAEIDDARGDYDLGFLRELSVPEARAWLTRIDGIGPKTASCVLLFSLGMPAMPVDTHVHRVSRRLGLIGERTSADAAHAILESALEGDHAAVYAFHVEMIAHGRAICVARRPRCGRCPLQVHCDYANHPERDAEPA